MLLRSQRMTHSFRCCAHQYGWHLHILSCGAYLPQNISIPRTAIIIASTDTLVALLAGLVIFPLVFGYGLEPTQGPGLIFETLPIAFGQMPMGYPFGIAFFLLLFFASVTSSVALLEHVVSWLAHAYSFSRVKASITIGVLAWILGLLSVVSFKNLGLTQYLIKLKKLNGAGDDHTSNTYLIVIHRFTFKCLSIYPHLYPLNVNVLSYLWKYNSSSSPH